MTPEEIRRAEEDRANRAAIKRAFPPRPVPPITASTGLPGALADLARRVDELTAEIKTLREMLARWPGHGAT